MFIIQKISMPSKYDTQKQGISIRIVKYLFLVPSFAILLYSTIVPSIWSILISFQNGKNFNDLKFSGINNYIKIFSDRDLIINIKNSLFIGIGSTVIAVFLGILLAFLIYRAGKTEGAAYRLIIFTPVMLPTAIVCLMFTFIFSPDMGILNNLLIAFGGENLTQAWLSDPKYNVYAISFVAIWKITGLTMILCAAGLQSIPISFFEASRLDGASYFKQVTAIMLPLIMPVIRGALTFTLLTNFKSFDIVFSLTRGGPADSSSVIPLFIYKNAFSYNQFGYSAALGIMMMFIILLTVLVFNKLIRGESYEF